MQDASSVSPHVDVSFPAPERYQLPTKNTILLFSFPIIEKGIGSMVTFRVGLTTSTMVTKSEKAAFFFLQMSYLHIITSTCCIHIMGFHRVIGKTIISSKYACKNTCNTSNPSRVDITLSECV